VSFESRTYLGDFLRHYNYQLYRQPMDSTAVFRADATFCPQTGQGGTGRVEQLPIRSSGTTTTRFT
jgi:hypothetical protein